MHARVHVPRHRQVEHGEVLAKVLAPPFPGGVRQRVRDRVGRQHQPRGAGAGHDEVGEGQLGRHGDRVDRHRARLQALLPERGGQPLRTVQRPVGDHQFGHTGAGQCRRGQRRHRARADDQRPLAAQPLRHRTARGQLLQPERDQRLPGPVDARLAVGPLPDPQRLLEQLVQQPARGVLVLRVRQRRLDLPEDLALAHHHRVQAAGHGEQMGDGPVLEVHVQVRLELLQGNAAVPGEQRGQLRDPAVEAVHLGVQLDPVARGEHRGLGDGRALHDGAHRAHRVPQQLAAGVLLERGAFQEADGRAAVAESDHDQRHAGITAGMSPSGP